MKSTDPIFMDDCDLQSKESMVFAGTTVVNGSCLSIVVSTGMNTEIGKIQKQIHEASLEEDDTPLKKKLDEFGSKFTVFYRNWVRLPHCLGHELQKLHFMGNGRWMASKCAVFF